jgi:pyruvate dehydrogenase E1 component
LAVIVQDGIRRMYEREENLFYYLTVGNENYAQAPLVEGSREGILKGIYRFQPAPGGSAAVQLFGSGSILNETLRAQSILAERFQVQADVWSVTSYNELRREALAVERWNRLHPAAPPRRPYLLHALEGAAGPIVAATDYMKIVPDQVSPWLMGRLNSLGTDGFGRSDNRQQLRRHFEVNAESIAGAALWALARDGHFEPTKAQEALRQLGVDTDAQDPAYS